LKTYATGGSEGLPVPREPAYAAKRSHDGEAPAASERANGRMPFANVRQRGTGSPELSAKLKDAQVENLRYERRQRASARAMSAAK
jgi:hypothetical protein